jgi:RimJ/RimL family protein N-acetyltransferase
VEPVEISAGSLHLRPPEPADVPALVRCCNEEQIAAWTPIPSPYTADDAAAYVARATAWWAEDRSAAFTVLDATSGALVGSVELFLQRGLFTGDGEIGYWVAADARGAGVGRRAVAAVCRWGFGALDLPRITWIAAVGNESSRRLAEAVGVTVEGTLRQGLVHRGRRRDCWIGSVLPGEVRG